MFLVEVYLYLAGFAFTILMPLEGEEDDLDVAVLAGVVLLVLAILVTLIRVKVFRLRVRRSTRS